MSLVDSEFAVTIASPCIGRCAVDEQRVCRGCHRTLGEIAAWPIASDEQKRHILAAVRQRTLTVKPVSAAADEQHTTLRRAP